MGNILKQALLISLLLLPLCLQAQEQSYRVTKCSVIAQHTHTPYQKSVSSEIGIIRITPGKVWFETKCFDEALGILNESTSGGTRIIVLNYRLKTVLTITGNKAELDIQGQFKTVFDIQRI
jgi:hypothetical protein